MSNDLAEIPKRGRRELKSIIRPILELYEMGSDVDWPSWLGTPPWHCIDSQQNGIVDCNVLLWPCSDLRPAAQRLVILLLPLSSFPHCWHTFQVCVSHFLVTDDCLRFMFIGGSQKGRIAATRLTCFSIAKNQGMSTESHQWVESTPSSTCCIHVTSMFLGPLLTVVDIEGTQGFLPVEHLSGPELPYTAMLCTARPRPGWKQVETSPDCQWRCQERIQQGNPL